MLDFVWYFNFAADIEDYILPAGYTMGIGNLYSSHFPRYESRIIKDNVIGGEMSTWVKFSEEILGNNGKIWDAIYLSEMLWDTERYDSRNRRSYSEIISKYIQPKIRDHIRGKYSVNGYSITDIMLPADTSLVPSDVKALAPEAIVMAEQKIAVNGCYDRLLTQSYLSHRDKRHLDRMYNIWLARTTTHPLMRLLCKEEGTLNKVPIALASAHLMFVAGILQLLPLLSNQHLVLG